MAGECEECGWGGDYRCRRCLTVRMIELEKVNSKLLAMAKDFAARADALARRPATT